MRNIFIKKIYVLLAVCVLFFSACRKDLGNYNYHEINEAEISNINETYSALRGSVLKVNPELKFTQDASNDTTKYTYAWYVIDQSTLPVIKTLVGTAKALEWPVSVAAVAKDYTLLYEVKEKSTGQIYRKAAALTVTTNIADGWLILSNIDGKARLDFLNYISGSNSFQPYIDVLSTQSKLTLEGEPKDVYYYNRRDPFSSAIYKAIAISTDQTTSIINTQDATFSKYANFLTMMTAYTAGPYYARSITSQAFSYLAYLYDSKGALFFENATMSAAWGTRINTTSSKVDFNISPYYAVAYRTTPMYVLMYDVDHKRFMEHKNVNTSSSVPVPTGNVFSNNGVSAGNVNMDLMYMASTPALGSRTYAVLKAANGDVYITTIQCNANTFTPLTWDKVTTAPEMAKAEQFAIDPNEGYLMYLVGSKIYRYNIFDKSNTAVLDMGSKKVSLIKYQKLTNLTTNTRYLEYASKLIVCTYDEGAPSTSGQMNLYTVPSLNGVLTLYKSFEGLGKIVAISYRE